MDVETAFLNAQLEEEAYLKPPNRLYMNQENKVLKLNRSLYGLKQAPRAWNQELTNTLKRLKFNCIDVDQSVLKCEIDNEECYLCFYVDDILIAGKEPKLIDQVKTALKETYKVTDLGDAKSFPGITIHRDRKTKTMEMDQVNKVQEYLKEHQVTNRKPNKTTLSVPRSNTEDEESIEHDNYQKIVGQLQN